MVRGDRHPDCRGGSGGGRLHRNFPMGGAMKSKIINRVRERQELAATLRRILDSSNADYIIAMRAASSDGFFKYYSPPLPPKRWYQFWR